MRQGSVIGGMPSFGFVLGLFALTVATPAFAQINLQAFASPAEAPPQLTTVHVIGSGFPTGSVIDPAAVSVTITPPAGNGGSVSTAPTAVFHMIGNVYDIQFVIPASLAAAQALPNCQVTVSGHNKGGVSFTSNNYSKLQIDPAATVLSMAPGAGTRGTTVTAHIVGNYTHYTTSLPLVTLTGPGGSPPLTPLPGSVSGSEQDAPHGSVCDSGERDQWHLIW